MSSRSSAHTSLATHGEADSDSGSAITSSFGGTIALRLALRRPDVFRSLSCHEPPLWGLLRDDLESQELLQQGARGLEAIGMRIAEGDHEGAAQQFVDQVAYGPGAWEEVLPPEARAMFIQNAPTFLDELQDPDVLQIDEDALRGLQMPACLTEGSESPPVFRRAVDRLAELIPRVTRETIDGAAHVPHLTNPERYIDVMRRALLQHVAA